MHILYPFSLKASLNIKAVISKLKKKNHLTLSLSSAITKYCPNMFAEKQNPVGANQSINPESSH